MSSSGVHFSQPFGSVYRPSRATQLMSALILVGCATTVDTGSQSVNDVQLQISNGPDGVYRMVDLRNRLVASASKQSGRLVFNLPNGVYLESCVRVFDPKQTPLFADRWLSLTARTAHQNLYAERQKLSLASLEDDKLQRTLTDQYKQARARLASNRAFTANQCVRPAQLAIPSAPKVKCTDRAACQQEAAAICFSRYLGNKGCAKAFDALKMPGLLSSPACSAMAAQLAREKYDLSDAFVDAILGALDDSGRQLRQSSDKGDVALGVVIGLFGEAYQVNEAWTCTNGLVEREYGPYERWRREASRIVEEPQTLMRSCQQDVQLAVDLGPQVTAAQGKARASAERVRSIEVGMSALTQERKSLDWCRPQL